ncbi:tectonic-2 isoform 2-T2 [Pholidichthys leucotaenia]
MASVVDIFFFVTVTRQVPYLLFIFSLVCAQNTIVFRPSHVITSGTSVSAFLLGNTSGVSLYVRTVSPSNTTGSINPPSCVAEPTGWVLLREQLGKTAVRVQLRLNQSLRLCTENDTSTDCCPKPLCLLQTLQMSACVDGSPKASLLIQAKVHARLLPANAASDNKTVIPNQVYQPLGPCPCDLTSRLCDVRCCCDEDCSNEELKLFATSCLPGPFGGQISPVPDYQCSAQSSENSPDWFPFLCVSSPPENNPFLGHFYQGDTIASKLGPSFQRHMLTAPVPVEGYIQGSPIFMLNDQYFTIPQKVTGRCVNNAPVAFLENFIVECVTLLQSCPHGNPLHTLATDLSIKVKDGQGGEVMVDVVDEVASDLSPFIFRGDGASPGEMLVCENVTLALDYKFYWKGNGITEIIVTRTIGTITLNGSAQVTSRYSTVFLNGEFLAEMNSGNPGYQMERLVIAGIMLDATENSTNLIQRTSINLWKSVGDGLCFTAEKKPVLFGENSTSGCLFPVTRHHLTQCDLLREAVSSLQEDLISASFVAKNGNPDLLTMTDWLNISFVSLNSNSSMKDTPGTCYSIPSHLHIKVWTLITSVVGGAPQREIQALQVSYSASSWGVACGGGSFSSCGDSAETQMFPITSSVTFIDIPINTGPSKTRFHINFTEYDCSRNDVCWPELAFPFTKYYTGEPYSQSLAKGMILVFFFITASILGTPWRQIRQVWRSAAL